VDDLRRYVEFIQNPLRSQHSRECHNSPHRNRRHPSECRCSTLRRNRMKKPIVLCLLFALVAPLLAVEGNQVMYTGGTVAALNVNTIGRLDATSETALGFESSGTKLLIPYADIQSFEYSTEVAHLLGGGSRSRGRAAQETRAPPLLPHHLPRPRPYDPSRRLRGSKTDAPNPRSCSSRSRSPRLQAMLPARSPKPHHSLNGIDRLRPSREHQTLLWLRRRTES
jgi:hypothetical protein